METALRWLMMGMRVVFDLVNQSLSRFLGLAGKDDLADLVVAATRRVYVLPIWLSELKSFMTELQKTLALAGFSRDDKSRLVISKRLLGG